jgi:uncharacterized protein
MVARLPDLIDPLEFAEKKRRVKGSLPLSEMDRLRGVVLNLEDMAEIDLEFRREGRILLVSGRVDANLALECQCCLDPLDWSVHSEVKLGMVHSIDEANLLPDSVEPLLLVDAGMMALADIVEDELLLAIPSIPQHSECVSEGQGAPESARRPFAVLAQLKKKV